MTEDRAAAFDCQRIDELAGAIALGALDPDALAAALAHIETCDQPHAELRDLLGADRALAYTVEPRDPSPELRARVMASVGAGAKVRRPARGSATRTGPRWFDWSSARLWRAAAIAAVGVLLVGALSWVGLRQQVATQEAALSAIAEVVAGGAPAYPVTGPAGTGYLIETEDGGATFLVAGLSELEAGQLYELWLLDAAGTPLAVGTIGEPDPQLAVARLERGLSGFTTFAVTVEQGRVDSPSSEPVMVAQLVD